MNKNWLIRTKSNHILGPVSKDKVLELYKNGSIKGDDEVCSGNGFWFFIREKDLIEKYLTGMTVQPFNPISEAKDVLTSDESSHDVPESTTDDVTQIGKAFNLKDLQDDLPPPPKVEEPEKAPEIIHQQVPVHDISQNKKKINHQPNKTSKKNSTKVRLKKDHSFIKYLGFFSFFLLLLLIYFRKTIMEYLTYVDLFPSAYAQVSEVPQKKKSYLHQSIEIDGITFRPLLGLEGLRIISDIKVETLDCNKFNDEVTQLGIILYPKDERNEVFLKRVRDCVLPLAADHPIKRWLKQISNSKVTKATELQISQLSFIDSLLDSGFNLIMAPEQKDKMIVIINALDENHLPERLLQSYLYLLIGNTAKSDSLLAQTYHTSPFIFWTKYPYDQSVWTEAISLRTEKIFERLSRHPADRTSFQLFAKYMNDFFNDAILEETTSKFFNTSDLKEKMRLKVYQLRTGEFSSYLLYRGASAKRKIALQAEKKERVFPWYWYFFKEFYQLSKAEKVEILKPFFDDKSVDSQLYFRFMASEDSVLESFYQSQGKSEIKLKRQFYLDLFEDKKYWWNALFNLIEIGDINSTMVEKIMLYENGL